MKKNLFSFCLFLLLTSLVLSACGGAAAPVSTEAAVPTEKAAPAPVTAPTDKPAATEAPASTEKKVATFVYTQELDNMNPMYTSNWYSRITQQIWNCDPWMYDDTNSPVPVLITEMPNLENGGISADGKTITLKLRKDIVWSDGEPITADDFVFTWEMYTNTANTVNSSYPYNLIKKIEAVDAATVKMSFDEPFIPWEASLGQEIIPAHILRPVFEKDGNLDQAAWNRAPTVGCGPYNFKEWETGSFVHFVRNEKYFNPAPKIDEIYIRFVADDAAQTAALLSGDADLGAMVSYPDIPNLEAANVKIVPVVSGYNEGWYFYFGEGNLAIKDVKVRQALALCFDRFSLVQDLLLGKTVVDTSFWQNTVWQDPDLKAWPFDPEKGKTLLEEAGWVDSNGDGIRTKDGVELILTHGATAAKVRMDTQAIAQEQLAKCGIKLETKNYAPPVFYSTYGDKAPCSTGELDICQSSRASSFPDPNTSLFLTSEIPTDQFPGGLNISRLSDPKLDELFKRQASEIDQNKRIEIFHEISRYMTENVYWLGMWNDPDLWGYNARLSGVKFSGGAPFFNVSEWDIK